MRLCKIAWEMKATPIDDCVVEGGRVIDTWDC